jgi:8-oxo-dGTP pyrophosphatase MutT (NUDIX family)
MAQNIAVSLPVLGAREAFAADLQSATRPQSATPPHRAAAQEAFEEAGVVGKVGKKTIGSYSYDKIFESGATVRCKVRVFPLRVTRQFKRWPEKRQRRTQWRSPAQASRRVRETYLRQIIRTFVKTERAAASNFATTGARWLIALG